MSFIDKGTVVLVCTLDFHPYKIGDMIEAGSVDIAGGNIWIGSNHEVCLKACWRQATEFESDLYYQGNKNSIPNL